MLRNILSFEKHESAKDSVFLPTGNSMLLKELNFTKNESTRLSAALEDILSNDMTVKPEDVLKSISDIKVRTPNLYGMSFESNDINIELQISKDVKDHQVASLEEEEKKYMKTLSTKVIDSISFLEEIGIDSLNEMTLDTYTTDTLSSELASLMSFNGVKNVSDSVDAILTVDLKSQLKEINKLRKAISSLPDDITPHQLAVTVTTTVLDNIVANKIIGDKIEKEVLHISNDDKFVLEELLSTSIAIQAIDDSVHVLSFGELPSNLSDNLKKPFKGIQDITLMLRKYASIDAGVLSSVEVKKLARHVLKTLNVLNGIDLSETSNYVNNEMPTYKNTAINKLAEIEYSLIVDVTKMLNISLSIIKEN